MKDLLPTIPLHPATIKQVQKGHPWVTLDQYSKRIAKEITFFNGTLAAKKGALRPTKTQGLFIHDPEHSQVVARLWSKRSSKQYSLKTFYSELKMRIDQAFLKRSTLEIQKKRENIILVFAESDQLPGLVVTLFGNVLLVQYYAYFWKSHQKKLTSFLIEAFKNCDFPQELAQIHFQVRNKKQELKKEVYLVNTKKEALTEIREFGVKYLSLLHERYDIGLYTDAANVREKLLDKIKKADTLLNLYCYTGAFSLYALKNNSKIEVDSVDLSQKVLDILAKNIELNDSKWKERHHSFCQSVNDFLKEKEKLYDLIICDPPPSFYDGKKKQDALYVYQKHLPLIMKKMQVKGHALIMLNTRKVTPQKFYRELTQMIEKNDIEGAYEISEKLQMSEDCPVNKNFPEGNYLKMAIITRHW